MKTGQLIVKKSHDPARRRLMIGALWLVCVVVGFGLYQFGQMQGGFNSLDAMQREKSLQKKIDTLAEESKRLQEQITIHERTQVIDQEAYTGVRDNLKQLQEEILELRQEVEFYRGIVSPLERQAGINIQSFKLDPAGEEGLYHYELVLTQVLKNDKFVVGDVNLMLEGVREGEPANLSFDDISPNNSVKLKFRFRYFQKLEGDIRVPDGFVPRTVVVEMAPAGRKSIERSFPWQAEGV